MTDYAFHTADVFTDKLHGGNPLAVIPDAKGLSDEQMAAITREFNYSESVFVLPPENSANARRLRIFTPGRELPFAGHPTVGTAFVLATIGEIPLSGDETKIIFEEGVGPVPVTIRSRNEIPFFSQLTAAKLPEVGDPPPPIETLAQVLSLEPSDLLANDLIEPEAVSCGIPFLFVPLQSADVLSRIKLNQQRWEASLKNYWAPEVFVFAADNWNGIFEGGHIRARMFAPGVGVTEDPATGSACAALAGFLGFRSEQRSGTLRWTIDQGVEMGRPSRLDAEVDLERGQVREIRVGGGSVLASSGVLHL